VPAVLLRESRVGRAELHAAGTLLALADDIDRRLPPGRGASIGSLARDGRLDVTGMPPMLLPAALVERCQAAFHREVRELIDVRSVRRRRGRPEVAVEFK
jgi:hypothetical protein